MSIVALIAFHHSPLFVSFATLNVTVYSSYLNDHGNAKISVSLPTASVHKHFTSCAKGNIISQSNQHLKETQGMLGGPAYGHLLRAELRRAIKLSFLKPCWTFPSEKLLIGTSYFPIFLATMQKVSAKQNKLL